jgi:hypothetical protein
MEKKSDATYEVRRIDLKKNPEHIHLVEQAYNEIYLSAFPIAEERQTLAYMRECLHLEPDAPRDYIFIAAGTDLDDPSKAKVDALGIGIYYKKAQTALLAYNAVRPGVRGLGRVMVEERIKAFNQIASREGHPLRGIYLEVSNPDMIDDDVMDPRKRIEAFQKWGAEIIPIDYTQPPLSPDTGKCDHLLLMNYPTVDGHRPSPEETLAFLREMYIASGKIPPETDPDFSRMKRQLLSPAFNRAASDSRRAPPQPAVRRPEAPRHPQL